MGEGLEQAFHMGNKHMKISSVSLDTREMQIKTTVRYHFTPMNTDIIKNKPDVGKDVEKLEPSYITQGNAVSPLRKIIWLILKNLKYRAAI